MSDTIQTSSDSGHSDAETPKSIDPIRSDIWYEDGSVILQAENTHFKVYRGVLSESSSVFKDMFLIPQPLSLASELIEGCTVVHLSDSAQELEYVLRALCRRE